MEKKPRNDTYFSIEFGKIIIYIIIYKVHNLLSTTKTIKQMLLQFTLVHTWVHTTYVQSLRYIYDLCSNNVGI